jgi:hypothetical protein
LPGQRKTAGKVISLQTVCKCSLFIKAINMPFIYMYFQGVMSNIKGSDC